MAFTRRRLFKICGITCSVLVVVFAVTYWLVLSSEPYQLADRFIRSSPAVNQDLGPIVHIRLKPLGFMLRYTGPRGSAEFVTAVEGEKGRGTAFVALERSAGIWRITSASLTLDGGKLKGIELPQR